MAGEKVILSIIIPVYNVEKYLTNCIESILNQKFKDFELILIDDGSSDSSGNICDKFSEYDLRIKTIHQKNRGVSYSRNVGIKLSKGKYIFFVDADDILEENILEVIMHQLVENNYDLIEFNYYNLIDNKKLENTKKSSLLLTSNEMIIKSFLDKSISISVWNKIFSKSLVKNVIFNEKYKNFEDELFLYNILLNCKKYKYLDIYGYNWRKHEGSASSSLFKNSYFDLIEISKIITENTIKSYPRIKDIAMIRDLENNLFIFRILVKSGNYKKYNDQYEKIRKFIVSQNKEIIKKLSFKRQFEVFLIKRFINIYTLIMVK